MTVNERLRNTRRCCGCGNYIKPDEIILKIENELFCPKCSIDKNEGVSCKVVDGTVMQIINKESMRSLPNGIYTLTYYHGMLFIKEKIENADSDLITELNETSGHVLEMRNEGFMLRFSNFSHEHNDIFDILSYEFEELDNIIDRKHEYNLKLIYSKDIVIGISVVPQAGVYKNNFVCFEHGFTLKSVNNHELKQNTLDVNSTNNRVSKYDPVDMLEYFEKRLIGQKKELRKIVYLFSEYLRMAESGKKFKASNWILTAPSGCGKTEVYRILREYFKKQRIDIPVLQIDLSQFTESGYKGKDFEEIIDIIAKANEDGDGTAIVFLDEADKKFTPDVSSSGRDYNASAQSNLLTLIEGSSYDKTQNSRGKRIIDTGKTMFVFMGAFQSIRNSRQKKNIEKNTIGFGNSCVKNNSHANCFYDDISIEDMIQFGMIEEIAGRIEQVINLHKISKEDMIHLIREKARSVSEEIGIAIEFDTDAEETFLDIAYTNLGIRSVTNCIRKLVCETISKVYYKENFDRSACTIYISAPDDAIIEGVEDEEYYEYIINNIL